MSKTALYCGTWNFRGPVPGIKGFIQNETTGAWEESGVYGELPNQSILTVAGDKVVAVSEMGNGGKVVSYRIEEDGGLTELDVLESPSAKLSYVVAAPSGRHVFASSMGDGTVKMIHISESGKLSLADEWKLTGHSVTPRQNMAKVHSVMISPDGKLLSAANLGADELELFRVDEERGTLRMVDSKPVDFGKEPRHMAFHPSGRWLYLLTEGGNRLYVFKLKEERLQEIAAYLVLNPDEEMKGAAADIVISRDGRFLYTSNRGQNSITVWRMLESGLLDRVGFFACGGEGPRGLNLSPDGRLLFSANNDSDTVSVLPVDPETGIPGAPLQVLPVQKAACVRSI